MANIFKTITSSISGKRPSDKEISEIPSFIFCRWLAGTGVTIHAGNLINQYYNIPIEHQYGIIRSSFHNKIKFIRYPKSNKARDPDDVRYIQKFYNISVEKAIEFNEFISEDELNTVRSAIQRLEEKEGK